MLDKFKKTAKNTNSYGKQIRQKSQYVKIRVTNFLFCTISTRELLAIRGAPSGNQKNNTKS